MIKTSVIVPCYNCEETIEKCVDSLIAQTYPFYEIILVDDGSNDKTAEICNKYRNENETVKVLHQSNAGLVRAWKNGVDIATGDYIVFCDADDDVDCNLVEKLIRILDEQNYDIVLFGYELVYPDGRKKKRDNALKAGIYDRDQIKENILPYLFFNAGMQSEIILNSRCCKAFSIRLLRGIIGEISDDLTIGEDDVTTMLSVINTDSLICIGDWCPYHYNRNADSMISRFDDEMPDKIHLLYKEIRRIANKYGYNHFGQIDAAQFSTTLLFIKKEVQRNPNGFKGFKKTVNRIRENDPDIFKAGRLFIESYSGKARYFAQSVLNRHYLIAYWGAKLLGKQNL